MKAHLLPAALALSASVAFAAPPEPKFRAQEIDRIKIGYGVAIADVDGDKKPDIILADQKQFVWYQNPGAQADAKWAKHLLAENLTKNDNVCVAAADIDGDGKCEIAVGAEWNPGDTVNSGAVFYLIAPEDRTKPWEAVKFPSVEPTTHRMRWMQYDMENEKAWGLVVVPLHGRGNKNNEGAGAKILLYLRPTDPRTEWKSELIDDSMHATHNFVIAPWPLAVVEVGGKEGTRAFQRMEKKWRRIAAPSVADEDAFWTGKNVGEVGEGRLQGPSFTATIEPMHGNTLAVRMSLLPDPIRYKRVVLTDNLIQGHALACADLLDIRRDQIVVGWRGNVPGDKVGIRFWTPLDDEGKEWRESIIDDNKMACEDLKIADLDGDGDIDIVASGRATKNVMIYWNETKK